MAYPTLNGIAPDWACADIVLNVPGGATLEDFDVHDISCSDSLEIGKQRGKGGKKKARGMGQADHEASMTLYRSGGRMLTLAIGAAAEAAGFVSNGQIQIGLVAFDIFYKHTPPGQSGIYLVKVMGCRLTGREFGGSEGADLDMVTCPLDPMSIVEVIDGKEYVLL
jgi:hypothetical protein